MKYALILYFLFVTDSYSKEVQYLSLSGPRIRYQGELEGDSRSNRKDLYVGRKLRLTHGIDTDWVKDTIILREVYLESSNADSYENPSVGYKKHYGVGWFYKWAGRDLDIFSLKAGLSVYNFLGDDINEVKLVPVVGFGVALNHMNLWDFVLSVGSGGRVNDERLTLNGMGNAGYDIFLEASKGLVEIDRSKELDTAMYGVRIYY